MKFFSIKITCELASLKTLVVNNIKIFIFNNNFLSSNVKLFRNYFLFNFFSFW